MFFGLNVMVWGVLGYICGVCLEEVDFQDFFSINKPYGEGS